VTYPPEQPVANIPHQPGPPQGGYAVPPAGYAPSGYGYPPPPRPVPTAPDGRPLAEFSDRLLAYLVDVAVFFGVGLVLMVPAAIGMFVLLRDAFSTVQTDPETGQLIGEPDFAAVFLPILGIYGAIIVISFLVSYIYYVEMLYKTGTTVGKRVMKIKIVRLDDPSVPLTRGVAAKRWLLSHVVAGFVPGLQLLDGLWQLWDQPYRQCLHDKWAGTIVVKATG
jgi:uncharacterized RDD family membrane protein YckC